MRRSFTRALALSFTVVVVAAGTASARAPGASERQALLGELGAERTAADSSTGALTFVGGTRARPAADRARLGAAANPSATARRFVDRYGALFGVTDAGRDLRLVRTSQAFGGGTFARFEQLRGGLPVIAGELTVQVDDRGNVVSASGEASTAGAVAATPLVSADDALAAAKRATSRQERTVAAALSATSPPALAVYDPALIGAPDPLGARLVWRVEVGSLLQPIASTVLVDAATGSAALLIDEVHPARDRRICDARNTGVQLPCTSPVRTEGSASSSVGAVNKAYLYAGQVYDFYSKRFGRDSLDNAGMALKATVRYCSPSCTSPNAFWYLDQTTFWPGLVADDVVGHEFTHGFTEHASGLLYAFQSGAINEGLSDIFGEFIDLTNGSGTDTAAVRWLVGEDTSLGAIRNMSDPTLAGHPDRMRSPLYVTDAALSDNGGVHANNGVANKAASLMTDGGTFNGQIVSGIGIDKAAAIWYRVASVYLASGSDYGDLGMALSQACSDMIGSTVNGASGLPSGTLSQADCTQVAKTVVATEMALQPLNPAAAAPEAPLCVGGTPVDLLHDQIDETATGWTAGGASGRWAVGTHYATSKPWHLHGLTPEGTGEAWLARADVLTLPAGAFLHFRHALLFDHVGSSNYDAGIVEYQLDDGEWLDAKELFTHNGYNGTVTSSFNTSPFVGRQAFVGYSWGYVSSRLDLAGLEGHAVRFRFHTATDAIVSDDGWSIDDVRVYTCAPTLDASPPTVSPPNANLRRDVDVGGTPQIKLRVSFGAADESGIASTELQRRANSKPFAPFVLGAPATMSADLGYSISTTTRRQLRARATDGLGNTSGWATADSFRVLAFQNGSAAIRQGGAWKGRSSSSHFGGSARSSSAAGAWQRLTMNASDFAIVSTLGPNRGKFDVWIDGVKVETIDLYSATTRYRRVVFAWDFGSAASHTVELRVTHTRNAKASAYRVDLDAFLALAP